MKKIKTFIENIFLYIEIALTPKMWFTIDKYSKEVDNIILELLEKYEFTNMSETKLTAKLGKATIWIANRPYSCIQLYGTCLFNLRPSRLTVLKALKKLEKLDKLEAEKDKIKYKECVEKVRNNLNLK